MSKESGFDSQRVQRIVLFSIKSRPALELTQSPKEWAQGAVSAGVKRQVFETENIYI
jgi:hypothetical protein